MAASGDLTTIAEVKTALQITTGADDDYLTSLIARVSEFIEHYCDREFTAQDIEEIFDGTGTQTYVVQQYPINSITALSRRTTGLNEDDWDSIDATLYFNKANSGQIIYINTFNNNTLGYKLEYNAGYTTIPTDLEQAAIDLIAYYYNNRKSKDKESESIGDYSVTYSKTKDVMSDLGLDTILDAYKDFRQG